MKSQRLLECTQLSEEILKNIELSEIPLKNIILKCLRLCRLMGDQDGIMFFEYETSGYPCNNSIMPTDSWRLSEIAGRRYFSKNKDSEKSEEHAFIDLIASMEDMKYAYQERMKVAKDPDSYGGEITPLAISRAKNNDERNFIVTEIQKYSGRIEKVKGSIYKYILKINNQLKYGDFVEDIFNRNREIVNKKLAELCPEAIQKFVSVYENMDSTNPEDWSNAVHSCRRIIKDVADSLYKSSEEDVTINGKKIKVGEDNYINRLILFIESKSDSKTYKNVVNSNLNSIGEKLDSINNAVCKGTHVDVEKYEAERYIIYTYLLLGDIISLL